MAADYYELLGVSRTCTPDELKRAYRKLAFELHPDRNPGDAEAETRFKEVTVAYETLSDPERRQRYDRFGPEGAGAMAGDPFGFSGGGLGDIFDAFFGGGMGGTRGPQPRKRPGNDALIGMDLDLSETAFGVEKSLTLDTAVLCETCHGEGTAAGTHVDTCPQCQGRGEVQTVARTLLGQVMTTRACPRCGGTGTVIPTPCGTCGGDGRVRARRTVTVKVPAGVEDGMRIRMAGQGEVGPGGGPAGDVYVEVHERRHATFTRDGDALHCELHLPMTAAALGTNIALETLDGPEDVSIRAGTQAGTIVTVRGKGVPRLRGSGRGDLFVHVSVITPTHLDGDQEELLRKLAALRGEEHPDGHPQDGGGLFGRLRDAFTGR